MINSAEDIKEIKRTIQSLAKQYGVLLQANPLDHDFYQQCVDEAVRRKYPMDGHQSVRTYLREGVAYTSICLAHINHKPTQIWVALVTSCGYFVDDAPSFASELPDVYQFHNRVVQGRAQGNGVLDAFADLLREAPEHFHHLPSNLIITSFLNFVSATLLEHETKDMKISSAAQEYPSYTRIMSGISEAYAFFIFPRDISFKTYIQAIPAIVTFINETNDVLSFFYKEEKACETTNYVSLLAARNNTSKLEALNALQENVVKVYWRILEILKPSTTACEAFKHYAAGLVTYHVSIDRYELMELEQ